MDYDVWITIRGVQLILASHVPLIGLLGVEIVGCIVSVVRVEIPSGVVICYDSYPYECIG